MGSPHRRLYSSNPPSTSDHIPAPPLHRESSSGPQSGNVVRFTELQPNSKFCEHATQSRKPTHGMSILEGKDSEENMLPMEDGTIMKTTNISLQL